MTNDMALQRALTRIEVLENEVAWLKSELGLTADLSVFDALRQRFRLTPKESELVRLLHARKGRAASKGLIMDALYRGRDEPEPKIVDVWICKIRRKMGDDAIRTLWGQGYTLSAEGMAMIDEALRVSVAA